MVVGVTASPRVSGPPHGPSGVTQRSSSWIASSGTPHSLGSGSWVHQVASLRDISAPWNRKNHGAGRVEPEPPPPTPPLAYQIALHPTSGSPSLFSSYLAIARKANSTFMPVLALVSMKGTPYSCPGESISSGLASGLSRHSPNPTGSHLLWPMSLHPQNGSLFRCLHPPVKPIRSINFWGRKTPPRKAHLSPQEQALPALFW